jgi:elongation factor P
MEKVTRLRKGNAVKYNNEACMVVEMQHKTPPNLASFVQMTLRNIATGKVYSLLRFSPGDSIETINIDRENYEFSYIDSYGYHFLHPTSYEDVTVPVELAEPVKNYLIEGEQYSLLFTDGTIAALDLPPSITMEVTESAEGVKGDSSTNVFKPATLSTGLIVQVPLFIKAGEKIVVKTEDGSYMNRA